MTWRGVRSCFVSRVPSRNSVMEAVGGTNPGYIAMCMPLIYVASVAGVPVSAIRTKAEVEALVQTLTRTA
ncbi:Uncharacterised protein [Pandoraea pnomenusa]|uniref:Uncharacterized protein n=1 Tax=Pandoraea pnomenusa TaxID=93220 RepID=A0A379KDB2_9BURK|nr:Uncharacterised protein [Pandoraea pnomenusa]